MYDSKLGTGPGGTEAWVTPLLLWSCELLWSWFVAVAPLRLAVESLLLYLKPILVYIFSLLFSRL